MGISNSTRSLTHNTRLLLGVVAALLVLLGLQALGAQSALADDEGNADVVADVGCMEEEAGFGLNCTANDVSIASVTNIVILDDGCTGVGPDDTVTFTADFEVLLTAQARHDIGLWFSIDGDPNGDASITGACTVATPAYDDDGDPGTPSLTWLDLDGTDDDPNGVIQDTCGDIDNDHNPLFPSVTITAVCADADGNGLLDLPNCTSWRQPGANDLCTSPDQAFPGAPSKCRCDEGFQIDIPVPQTGTIKIVKDVVPDDSGSTTWDLQIDGSTVDPSGEDVIDGGMTDVISVGAGTNQDPGASYTVSETAGDGNPVDPAVYDSSYACTESVNEQTAVSGEGTSATFTVNPNDAWTCTFTNTLRTGTLTLVKVVDNLGESGPGYLGVGDFPLTIDGDATSSGTTETVLAGDHTISETGQPGYTVGTWSCDNGSSGDPGSDTATVNVVAGTDVTCSITNTLIAVPLLSVVKSSTTTEVTAADQVVPYSYLVTNEGNVTLTGVGVSDNNATGESCDWATSSDAATGDGVLSPGETVTCSASHTVTQAEMDAGGTLDNIVTASSNEAPDAIDDLSIPINQNPSLTIDKSPDIQTVTSGQTATFTITVSNDGNVTLTGVTVSDPEAPNCDRDIGNMAPGDSVTYTCTLANVTSPFTNVATADSDQTDPVSDSADVLVVGDLCVNNKPPTALLFQYDGDDPDVFIVVEHHRDGVIFADDVSSGDSFTVTRERRKLNPELTVTIYDAEGGNVIDMFTIHTSCSVPLYIGQTFGADQDVAKITVLGEPI